LHPTVCRSSPCTLAEFRDWAQQRAPSNWAKECGLKSDDGDDTWKGLAIAFGILAGLFAVLFIFMLWTYLRMKKFRPLYDPDGELLQ